MSLIKVRTPEKSHESFMYEGPIHSDYFEVLPDLNANQVRERISRAILKTHREAIAIDDVLMHPEYDVFLKVRGIDELFVHCFNGTEVIKLSRKEVLLPKNFAAPFKINMMEF